MVDFEKMYERPESVAQVRTVRVAKTFKLVYGWMALGLALSGVVAWLTASYVLQNPEALKTLLRGPVFSMCEKEGTAAAVFFGAVIMPLFYVYPQAYMPALLIGAVCSLLVSATDSLIAAIAVHLACRTALWAGDLLSADAAFLSNAGIYICILVFLFFLCTYRMLRTYAGLVRDELLTAPVPGAPQATQNLRHLFFTPGFLLFFTVFLVRFLDMMLRYVK